MIWWFRRGLFRPFGPAWLAWVGYRYWKRLPPAQKAAIKGRAQALATKLRQAVSATAR